MNHFLRSTSQSTVYSSGMLAVTRGLPIHESALQPSPELNDYAENVTSDDELQIPGSYQTDNYSSDSEMNLPTNSQLQVPSLGSCSEATSTSAFAVNYERSFVLDGTYGNSFGEGTDECVPNLQRNRYHPPQNAFSNISSHPNYFENCKPIHSGDERFPCDAVHKNPFLTSSNFETHEQTPEGANSVKSDGWLEVYERTHTGGKQSRFNNSNVTFNHRSNLWKHAQIHTGKKIFQYDTPRKVFSRSFGWRRHDELIHIGETPFLCNSTCGKIFPDKGKLKKHAQIHSREMRFQCGMCEKNFLHESSWKRHELTHTGGKPFRCNKCEKTFYLKSNLKKHEMIHTREKLSFQENVLTERQYFENHKRIYHSGKDPIKCVTWMKSYPCPSALERHERTNRYDPENSPNVSSGIGLDRQHEQKLHSDRILFQRDVCKAEPLLQKKLDERMCDDLVQLFQRHRV